MSREIKFRVWDADSKKYWNIENWHVEDEYIDLIEPNNSNADPNAKRIWKRESDVVLEQFTGMKDAYGDEIYEGDIIKYFGAKKRVKIKTTYGIVFYDSEHGCFNSRIQNKEHNKGGISLLDDLIVGNVHTNPELLEEDK